MHGRPVLVADHLRNPENMGALIRLADNAGASEVVFLGDSTQVNLSRVKRVAASSCNNLPWKFMETETWLNSLPSRACVVAIETTSCSVSLFDLELPDHPVFVVGNEVHGISAPVLQRASLSVHIPVPGPTRSLNVSHAAALVLFGWIQQKLQNMRQS